MTEEEAIVKIARGAHPGNFFSAPFLSAKDDYEATTKFVHAIPEDWYAFRRLVVGWWLPTQGYVLTKPPPSEREKIVAWLRKRSRHQVVLFGEKPLEAAADDLANFRDLKG